MARRTGTSDAGNASLRKAAKSMGKTADRSAATTGAANKKHL
jgi:hypothetical protein